MTVLIGACAVALLPAGCGDDPVAEVAKGTRTIEHALGTAEVPERPQRVVATDSLSLETMLALGMTPVAASGGDRLEDIADVLDVPVPQVEEVYGEAGLNLEAIAAVEPDLILGESTPGEGIAESYDDLTRLAPTVGMAGGPEAGPRWKESFLTYAEALGRRDRAEELLAAHDGRAAALKARFEQVTGTPPGEVEISVVRFRPDMSRTYQDTSFVGSVIAEAGFARPATQRGDADGTVYREFSLERLGDVDADHLFVFGTNASIGEEADAFAVAQRNPLWGTLDAVRAGRVHAATRGEFWLEGGVLAAGTVLDDLERYLVAR